MPARPFREGLYDVHDAHTPTLIRVNVSIRIGEYRGSTNTQSRVVV